MPIIFLNRFFYPDHSATSQMLTDLAFHLADKELKVVVITSRQRYDDPAAELPVHEEVDGVEIHRVHTPRFGRGNLLGRSLDYLGFYIAASIRLWQLCQAEDTVVAKTDPPLISVPAAWISRRKGARLINWLQDLFPEVAIALGVRGLNGTMGRALRAARNWSLKRAANNVAIGNLMRECLLGEGVPPDKITVIPNWADASAIKPVNAAHNPLRTAWDLQGKFVVGYSGNIGRAHEFETLLNAAELLRHDDRVHFLFIGGGHQLNHIRTEIERRGLRHFLFRPYQPRESLAFSLGVADVHLVVLRPELEGLIVPSKTYGSLAAGRPILFVGAENGEIPELLRREAAGRACRTEDPACLAASIRALAVGETWHAASQSARAAVERAYDLKHACAHWDALIAGISANPEYCRKR